MMARHGASLLIGALIASLPAVSRSGQETYAIGGVVAFPETGRIHVYLVDEEAFGKPLTGIRTMVIEPDELELADGSVRFSFEGIRASTYGIRCFQDVNGDGKLNKGMLGPSEPWGMSWKDARPARWPRFDSIAFDVGADLESLRIELR